MDDRMSREFIEFIEKLGNERNNTSRDDFKKSFDHMISMSKAFMSKCEFSIEEFEKLNRYVSDCLPWSEDLLKTWNSIKKIQKEKKGVSP